MKWLGHQVKKVGKVVRAICFMSHPVPNTGDSDSVQIILPQKQLGRKSDMYVFCCSHSHNVAPKGKYIAFVSAEVETENPEKELEPGLALLGHIDEKIIDMYDMLEPVNDSSLDNCFISKVRVFCHVSWCSDLTCYRNFVDFLPRSACRGSIFRNREVCYLLFLRYS